MAIPGAFASVTLTIAVACRTGASQATAKCAAIAIVLIAINSVVTHATAAAFRMRDLGHWEPRPGEVEFGKPESKS
jgi:multisubunit Na+/H+ antiporter MnhG subunit